MKCLIVEDDFTARKLLLAYLSKHVECDVAVNGKETIKAFHTAIKEKPYDLLCMDISMPEMNGMEALRVIRQIEKRYNRIRSDGVKVIMTTAFSDKDNVITACELGCKSYLVKPVSREKLFAEIKKLGFLLLA